MSKTLKMYGLGHCSTCQKAISALEDHGWKVDVRDVQKEPLSQDERATLVADFEIGEWSGARMGGARCHAFTVPRELLS